LSKALSKTLSNQRKIALVHDWLNQNGGAENVLEEFVSLFPGAPVYTSMYAPEKMPDTYREWPIQTSFMQRLPGVTRYHQPYLPFYPLAFARTDLREYDLVLSNKSGFCHGIQAGGKGQRPIHICYCLTPTRFLWLYEQYREREQINGESVVIHPPVDTTYFQPDPTGHVGDYYLIVGRLIPYKRVDLAVEAFSHLPNEKLIVIGDGRDLEELSAQSGPNVTFLGRQSREKVLELLQGCKAFIFPGLEDFGIAPVEAMSVGRPVIAFAGGGALDTVVPGITGELFAQQDVESLLTTLQNFDAMSYDPVACRQQAERFSTENFRHKLLTFVEQKL